jgi:hypothetical protein
MLLQRSGGVSVLAVLPIQRLPFMSHFLAHFSLAHTIVHPLASLSITHIILPLSVLLMNIKVLFLHPLVIVPKTG